MTERAIDDAVSRKGGARLLRLEVRKLVVSAAAADRLGWFEADVDRFAKALDTLDDDVASRLQTERSRNDEAAPKIGELQEVRRSVTWAGDYLGELSARGSAPPASRDS